MATPRLGLTEHTLGQSALETAVNAQQRIVEAFAAGLEIVDDTLTTPPSATGSGDAYIVAAGASGDWAGQDGKVAVDVATDSWAFVTPLAGMRARLAASGELIHHNGSALVADSSLSQGTAFPADPTNRRRFFRTDLDCEFFWDATRSKWLSVEMYRLECTEPTALTANTYADLIAGVLKMSSAVGWQLPWDATIVAGHAHKADTSGVALFRFRRNGTNVAVITFAAAGDRNAQSSTLNADVAATTGTTDALAVFIQPGASQSAAGNYCCFYLRRHAT